MMKWIWWNVNKQTNFQTNNWFHWKFFHHHHRIIIIKNDEDSSLICGFHPLKARIFINFDRIIINLICGYHPLKVQKMVRIFAGSVVNTLWKLEFSSIIIRIWSKIYHKLGKFYLNGDGCDNKILRLYNEIVGGVSKYFNFRENGTSWEEPPSGVNATIYHIVFVI